MIATTASTRAMDTPMKPPGSATVLGASVGGASVVGSSVVVPRAGRQPMESHRYVRFTHPPDPHFDDSALRARLVAALDEGRREAADSGAHRPGFAELWEEL